MGPRRSTVVLGMLAWGLATTLGSAAARAPSADERARTQVRQLLEHQAAAWNRGDLDGFCAVYAEDALFLSPSGVTRGRSEIVARYRSRYADRAAMGTLDLEPIEMRPLGGPRGAPHGLSVAARWTLRYPDREPASGLTLIVLHRQGERWTIVQDASW